MNVFDKKNIMGTIGCTKSDEGISTRICGVALPRFASFSCESGPSGQGFSTVLDLSPRFRLSVAHRLFRRQNSGASAPFRSDLLCFVVVDME